MAKQVSILKFRKTEISENEPRQMAASLINSIIDTVIQLAVKKQKRHTGRKKSVKEDTPLVQAAKEEVLPGYEEYLVLLQERNKLQKRLRKKNKSQIELEQKEQGFSLYVNGPHKDGRTQAKTSSRPTIPTQPKTGRKPKTAGERDRHLILDERALQDITREEMERQREERLRSKTAPSARERRRNWDMNSVEIKTTTGDRRKVKAPEILTGRYDDDFESDDNSDQLRSSASENSEDEPEHITNKKQSRGDPPMSESNEFNSSDSVNSADEELRMSKLGLNNNRRLNDGQQSNRYNKKSPPKRTRRKGRPPDPDSDSDSEGHNEKLLLSMSELKTLRHNLSMNKRIRQSMAEEVSSEEEDNDPEFPIPEVDEDIPSDDSMSPAEDSPRRDYSRPLVKPQDTIVLDFGGGAPGNRKVEKNLSAARKKDIQEDIAPARKVRPESAGDAPKPTPRSIPPRTQSAHTLMSNDTSKKSVRPLSANRKSSVDHAWADTDSDASAVMAALRAENEQASRFGKEERAPQRKPRPGSGSSRELPSPVIDKTERPPKTHQMRALEDTGRSSLIPPDKIEQIMEKVLKMTPKHQKRLVKMLGKIENSVIADSVMESPEDRPNVQTGRKPASRPVKASTDTPLQARRSLNQNSLNSVNDENIIEVHIEIKSNWGHAMRLGLTEIQLFDDHNTLIPIDPSDVKVYGAEECRGTVDVLFNGKCKSNKERNMWSCRYHARRPVEFMILARNPSPQSTDKFSLSQMKIWNFNKSINDLDQGVKDIRVFVGTDLMYTGTVEKGCGNQVFDYCQLIPLKRVPKPSQEAVNRDKNHVAKVAQEKPKPAARNLPSPPRETRKVKEFSDKSQVKRITSNNEMNERTNKSNVSANAFERDKSEKSYKSVSPVANSDQRQTSLNKGSKPVRNLSKGQRSPSPSPKFPPNLSSPRTSPRERPNHRSISPSPNREHKKTLRSISMSSGSEASSGGERTPRQSPSVPALDLPRSETRTISHASSKLHRPNVGSDSENDETPRDGPSISKARDRRRAANKTPRKSKRMAARLDGHGSAEVDSSKSVSESSENRPPLPPPRKSEEKLSPRPLPQKPEDSKPRPVQKELSPEVGAGNKAESDTDKLNATGSSTSVASSMDDTPMLQKLKDMNKKDQSSVRKKEVPRWLKAEDVSTPFQSPADSYNVNQEMPKYEAPKTPPTQDEINMLIDEEMSKFPGQKSEQKPQPSDLGKTAEQETPMKRIQQNRSKWRENPSLNLEESWGSLTQFNQHQRGRLSMDMDDDIFDEYLNNIGKKPAAPTQPPIPEEPVVQQEPSTQTDMDIDSDEEGVVIPELPYGRELIINIRTTWGDKHYVGLTGVEIFSSTGEQVNITKIRAEPSDINVLPEYKKDPRVVDNLIDGVNRTRDDVHMWLAPFNPGQNHLVFLSFDKPCKVAMIRIWNYNKSRIHSYRGAKDVMMALDSVLIFKGEIARACGGVEGGTEAFGDTILFTMDEQILEAVSQNDEAYEGEMLDEDEPFDVERPTTADDGESGNRPFTRAVGNIKQMERQRPTASPTPRPETALTAYEGDILVYKGNCIELNFTATWGDLHYLGLTGLEIVGKDGEALPVTMDMITANPRDVRSLQGHERDDRTLDKLIDGTNVTVSDEHMWLIPFTEGQNHTITVNFGQKVMISGLRLWNYNKSKEDTYRGARIVHVSINGRMVSPPGGYLVRKGLGNCHFDYAQEVSFSADNKTNTGVLPQGSSSTTDESQNYEVIQMPCGFIYQFQLFTTWGDPYYIGLNGIELYDANLQKMQLTESNISAYPDSVNVLDNISSDVRTPDKLIDGINDTTDGGHMWLAPILPSILNRVYVIFDQPTSISMIKIWNYSKNYNRGAKDFALLVDDLLVYNGELQSVPKGARGILPNCEGPQPYHTILFVNNKDILRKERNTIINNQTGEQDVQMTNDKKVMSHYNDPKKAHAGKPVDQNLRPTTSVVKHIKKRR